MSKSTLRLAILMFFCLVLTQTIVPGQVFADGFKIIYSNNVNGETEPCG